VSVGVVVWESGRCECENGLGWVMTWEQAWHRLEGIYGGAFHENEVVGVDTDGWRWWSGETWRGMDACVRSWEWEEVELTVGWGAATGMRRFGRAIEPEKRKTVGGWPWRQDGGRGKSRVCVEVSWGSKKGTEVDGGAMWLKGGEVRSV